MITCFNNKCQFCGAISRDVELWNDPRRSGIIIGCDSKKIMVCNECYDKLAEGN